MVHTLAPLEPPFEPEVAALLAGYPQVDGYLLSLFRTFANSGRFLRKGVANLLDKESPLSLRQREIVILRVTAKTDCEYEWGVHVAVFAKAARLGDEEVAATRLGDASAACWSEAERVLVQAIDDLCATARIGDQTLAAFQRHWTREQQLEVLALCGNYHTVAFVANSARLPLEPFSARFPEA